MAGNIDTLRETTNDLLQANKDNHHNTITVREMLQWKFDVMKETIQLKYQVPEKAREEHQIILDRFNKIVFDQNHEEPFTELLSMIDYCYPGLQALIEDRYPTLSEKEGHICYLTFEGLSVKEVSALLHQSENSIYKVRSAINKKIGDNFCSILKEEYIMGYDT